MGSESEPVVTIAVVTYKKRLHALQKMLRFLALTSSEYNGNIKLLVANNSGFEYHEPVNSILTNSNLDEDIPWKIIDCEENNIAIARNAILDNAGTDWLAFIDDDEYPSALWLNALVEAARKYQVPLVAGPIIPIFPKNTVYWVTKMDLHNAHQLKGGSKLAYAASGNILIHLPSTNGARFDPEFGRSGGEDTEYFLRLTSGPGTLEMVWAEDAIVYEDIPDARSTTKYNIMRCLSQGGNFRRTMFKTGKVKNIPLFYAKAITVGIISLVIAVPLALVKHNAVGKWMKRAFSNFGKLYNSTEHPY